MCTYPCILRTSLVVCICIVRARSRVEGMYLLRLRASRTERSAGEGFARPGRTLATLPAAACMLGTQTAHSYGRGMAAGQAERGVGEIRSHREFVRTMVQDDGHRNDRGVVLDAVRAEGQGTNVRLGAAPGRPRDRAGGRGAKAAVPLSSPLRTFCPTVSSYLAAARQNVQALEHASPELRSDREVVFEALV